jgi:hypothetical protein
MRSSAETVVDSLPLCKSDPSTQWNWQTLDVHYTTFKERRLSTAALPTGRSGMLGLRAAPLVSKSWTRRQGAGYPRHPRLHLTRALPDHRGGAPVDSVSSSLYVILLYDACRPCGDSSMYAPCRDRLRTELAIHASCRAGIPSSPCMLRMPACVRRDAESVRRGPCLCRAPLSDRRVQARGPHRQAPAPPGSAGRPSLSGSGGGVSTGGPGRQAEELVLRVG